LNADRCSIAGLSGVLKSDGQAVKAVQNIFSFRKDILYFRRHGASLCESCSRFMSVLQSVSIVQLKNSQLERYVTNDVSYHCNYMTATTACSRRSY
jgi:hypothetical protein